MVDLDFNRGTGSSTACVVPPGSIVFVKSSIMYPDHGRAGVDPALSRSGQSPIEYLGMKLVVQNGAYSGISFYQRFYLYSPNSEGHDKAIGISRETLREILEAAHGICHEDSSARAMDMRKCKSLNDFDGLVFPVCVGCEPGRFESKSRPGFYHVFNKLDFVVLPGTKEWIEVQRQPTGVISGKLVPEFPIRDTQTDIPGKPVSEPRPRALG